MTVADKHKILLAPACRRSLREGRLILAVKCSKDKTNERLTDTKLLSYSCFLQGENKSDSGKKKRKGDDDNVGKKNDDEVDVKDDAEVLNKVGRDSENFEIKNVTADGRTGNVKIISWNCAGLKALVKKFGLEYLKKENPDIICLQETKCDEKGCPPEVTALKHGGLSFAKDKDTKYHMYFSLGEKKGYSGTAIWTKGKPIKVTYGLGVPEHDKAGRMITAEYDKFYLVTTYVPNSSRGLVNLEYRMRWEKDMKDYLKKLENAKPVILCGDLNVAHNEIDIANPKSNQKNAGFTKEERNCFTELLGDGFIDSYRHLNPEKTGAYTFWTYMGNAREKNVGWRLDYFVLSESIIGNLCDSVIRSTICGSDHCPIVLAMAF
eukprot:gene516-1165_t